MITSFSGMHPYRPQCLITQFVTNEPDDDRDKVVDFVEMITALIDRGRCARCAEPLPTPPVLPGAPTPIRCRRGSAGRWWVRWSP